MDLEQALAEIEKLKTKISGLADENATQLKTVEDEHKKALQVQFNKGFDKAKNAVEDEKKDYLSKDDVDKMLAERDEAFNQTLATEKKQATARETLLNLGVKNPSRSLKIIDEEDFNLFGTEDFNSDTFLEKYQDDIVFKKSESNLPSANFMKNNEKQVKKLTLAEYAEMPKEERMKLSQSEREALK